MFHVTFVYCKPFGLIMCKSSETSVVNIELLSGNIFHVTVKEGAVVGLESAKRLIQATNEMLDDENPLRGGVYDISGVDRIDDDARNYLAKNSDIKGFVVGVALISDTFLGKMVGNLFITLSGERNFPIQFFDSPILAERWIRQVMKEAEEKQVRNKDVA